MGYETRHDRPPVQPGMRYCMRCHLPKPQQGGGDVVSANKMRRQWHCEDCRKGGA